MARSTTARGYGTAHQKQRAKWAKQVDAGTAYCARCGRPINPGTPWDLDHTEDRSGYLGPSHARCNRATAGKGKRKRRRKATARPSVQPLSGWIGPNGERWSRDWGGGTWHGDGPPPPEPKRSRAWW